MKKFVVFLVFSLIFIQPIVRADGIPYPYIRPQIREEHQIVLMELKDKEKVTTLDLGIRNRPETVFSILDESIYISESNPFWLKTFLLPSDFELKDLCINSYDFSYFWNDKSPVELTINNNVVYLYTPRRCRNHAQCSQACSKLCPSNVYGCCFEGNLGQCNLQTEECYCSRAASFCGNCPSCNYSYEYCDGYSNTCKRSFEIIPTGEATAIVPPREYDTGQIFCRFMENDDLTDRKFINVSTYLKPGEYNTIEIRSNIEYRSFSVRKIYLSSETKDLVKIIIPFKTMPNSVEVGGYGLNTWELDRPFQKKEKYWYGYYGGRLLSEKEAPALANIAQSVETSVKSQVTQTQVATDVTGGFKGQVSNVLTEASLSKPSSLPKGSVISFAGSDIEEVYRAYLEDNAYVIELRILPYELKRITIKWIEDVTDENQFQYYYPLGTGRTWLDNISYTAIYVKLPENYKMDYANLPGKDEAQDSDYNYYRWKLVETKPTEDLILTVKKVSEVETFLISTYVPIIGLIAFVVIILALTRFKLPI